MNMSMLSVGNLDNKIIASSVQVSSNPNQQDKKREKRKMVFQIMLYMLLQALQLLLVSQ